MIPRVTRGVIITSNEWMKQALLDGIDQSQSTLFPDYRHLNPTSRNGIRKVRDKPEIQIIRIRHRSETRWAFSRKRVGYSYHQEQQRQRRRRIKQLSAKKLSRQFPAEGYWLRLVLASTRSLRPLFFLSPQLASIQVAIAEKWPKKVKYYSTCFLA